MVFERSLDLKTYLTYIFSRIQQQYIFTIKNKRNKVYNENLVNKCKFPYKQDKYTMDPG